MKQNYIHTSFVGGRLSPLLMGRVDLKRYYQSCKELKNFVVLPQGGVRKRGGTIYVADTKDQATNKKVRLIPFRFANDETYILEFGDLYIRIYNQHAQVKSGGVPVEVVTPYTYSEIFELQYAQTGDVIFLNHKNYSPRRLERLGQTNWVLRTIVFDPPPIYEADLGPNTTLTPGATSGSGVTFTAGASVPFLAGDVDRHIIYGSSRAVITSVTSVTQVVANILDSFPDINPIPAGQWFLTGSPSANITPSKKEPIKAQVTVTASVACFRSADVGKYIFVHGGMIKITGWTDTLNVTGILLTTLSAMSATPTWQLEVVAWDSNRGYPGAVALFEQRIFYAGSKKQPKTIWGSKVNKYENFAVGTKDDDGVEFTIASNQMDPLLWLADFAKLLAVSGGGEYLISGAGTELAISPTSIKVKSPSTVGSKRAGMVKLNNAILFAQRAGRKLMELKFDFELNDYVPRDLSITGEDLTYFGIVDMAYQREPYSIIWVVTEDGRLVGLTYNLAEEIVAWHEHEFDTSGGLTCRVNSVATMINNGYSVPVTYNDKELDELWMVVELQTATSFRRIVCYMSDQVWTDFSIYEPSVTQPKSVYTGLGHLEGLKVVPAGSEDKATFAEYAEQAVVGGQITVVDSKINAFYAGRRMTSKIITVPPEIPSMGTRQGRRTRWIECFAKVNKTKGLRLNGKEVAFRKAGDNMDMSALAVTGDMGVSNLGYDIEGKVEVVHDYPFPATVLAIFGSMQIGEL